jgi:hypothetical protein
MLLNWLFCTFTLRGWLAGTIHRLSRAHSRGCTHVLSLLLRAYTLPWCCGLLLLLQMLVASTGDGWVVPLQLTQAPGDTTRLLARMPLAADVPRRWGCWYSGTATNPIIVQNNGGTGASLLRMRPQLRSMLPNRLLGLLRLAPSACLKPQAFDRMRLAV